jgi:hypothetical protein
MFSKRKGLLSTDAKALKKNKTKQKNIDQSQILQSPFSS